MLSNLKVAKQGDLYLAADLSYIDMARKSALIAEHIPLALQKPVIIVPKGNPKQIKQLDDLLADGLKISLANPDAASVGER